MRTVEELIARLRQLRAWSGLGYHEIHRRIVELWSSRGIPDRIAYNTVYRCMQPGRRRLNVELVVGIARVLLGNDAAAAPWRMAHRVVAGQASAAAIVGAAAALPEDLVGFTGRREELRQLLGLVDARASSTALVSVIEGMAGVGKTTLAIRVGHDLVRAGRFRDLQLSVNLRGYDPDQPPADPAAVLDTFLRILGVSGDQIYHLDLAGRSARYRQLLAGKRALIVLDNAASVEQVHPLLPGSAGSLTMITSRRALGDLPATLHLRLDAFTQQEALDLLRRSVGSDRVEADPDTAARIAQHVGHLPLALGLVAGRITDSPEWTLADHLARLAERRRQRRLDDAVELAFDLSYGALRPQSQRLVRLLSLHCGDDVDVYATAALGGSDLDTAQRHLDELVSANLIQPATPTRYRFHDLVHIYASACATDGEPDSARRDALTRLFDSYLYTASLAMDTLHPFERHRRPRIPPPATPVPPIVAPAQAMAWLTVERSNLLASICYTAEHGWPGHTGRFAATLWRRLDLGGLYSDALTIHRHAVDAARRTGDRPAECTARINLAGTNMRLGQQSLALGQLRTAIGISREVGDRLCEGRALGMLGLIGDRSGRYAEALEHFSSAAAIYRETGDRSAEGRATGNTGNVLARMGRYDEAIRQHRYALDISRGVTDRANEAVALGNLSFAYARLGRLTEAQEFHRRALALHREVGSRAGEAFVLTISGDVHGAGHEMESMQDHQRAAAIAREINDPGLEAAALNSLGESLRALGRVSAALREHQLALILARNSGDRYERARAHDGLGCAMHVTGRQDGARRHWRHALALYQELGLPQAGDVKRRLDTLEATDAG